MNSHVIGGLTLRELAFKTWREFNRDRGFGKAAELAYYSLLALFPMLIFLLSLVAFLPGAQEMILSWLAKGLPSEVMRIIDNWVKDVVRNRSGSLLSFALLGSLWAASNGTAALIDALNTAYDVEEGRPYWKKRLVALALTIALGFLVVGGAALVTFGGGLVTWLSSLLILGTAITFVWQLFNKAIGFVLLILGMGVLYNFAPNLRQKWRWITPGSVFALTSFIVASYLFSLYLKYAPSNSATYGSLGAVVVLMLWLYLTGLVMIFGGEINSEIRKAAGKPSIGKEPSQRDGERREPYRPQI
jgi:membrane protein